MGGRCGRGSQRRSVQLLFPAFDIRLTPPACFLPTSTAICMKSGQQLLECSRWKYPEHAGTTWWQHSNNINMSDFWGGWKELVCRLNLWRMELFKYMKVGSSNGVRSTLSSPRCRH